ncbi:MAG TPA: hypothetical protein VEF03_02430, partial [Candidatus Binataceae bacterium]|nr:hypothetical protein [Candidatus Binataceae bacterium]
GCNDVGFATGDEAAERVKGLASANAKTRWNVLTEEISKLRIIALRDEVTRALLLAGASTRAVSGIESQYFEGSKILVRSISQALEEFAQTARTNVEVYNQLIDHCHFSHQPIAELGEESTCTLRIHTESVDEAVDAGFNSVAETLIDKAREEMLINFGARGEAMRLRAESKKRRALFLAGLEENLDDEPEKGI